MVGAIEKGQRRGAFAPFHAQLGPLQVTIAARFYGIRAKETSQNLNEGTRIANELPRLNREPVRVRERTTSAGLREPPQRWWPPVAQAPPAYG